MNSLAALGSSVYSWLFPENPDGDSSSIGEMAEQERHSSLTPTKAIRPYANFFRILPSLTDLAFASGAKCIIDRSPLEKEGWSGNVPNGADYYFRGEPKSPYVDSVREFYSKIRETQEKKIAIVKEKTVTRIKEIVQEALSTQDSQRLEAMKAELVATGTFGRQWLEEMYRSGASGFSSYVESHYYLEKNRDVLRSFCDEWVTQVTSDFFKGMPHAFGAMCELLSNGKIGKINALSNKSPFNRCESCFNYLKIMAFMGVKDALESVADACRREYGSFAMLVAWGHEASITQLREHEKDSQDPLRESLGKNRSFVTVIDALILGGEDLGLSVAERLNHLTDRAKQGHQKALLRLWGIIHANQIQDGDSRKVELNLSEEERCTRIQSLRTSENEAYYDFLWFCALSSKSSPFASQMTAEKRLKSIENAFFDGKLPKNEKSFPMVQFLTECYRNNHDCNEQPLNLSFKERLDKLEMLTSAGISGTNAMYILNKFYLPTKSVPQEMQMKDIPKDMLCWRDNIAIEERRYYIISLCFEKGHKCVLDGQITLPMSELFLDVYRLALAHLQAVKKFK